MPLAERSLEHIISAERIAGRELDKIRYFAKDIGKALAYLHQDRQLVHADFKPRNIVRIGGDWKLIDFDAAVQVGLVIDIVLLYYALDIISNAICVVVTHYVYKVGEVIGLKTSTAFVPPELAALLFRPKESLGELEMELKQNERERDALKESDADKDVDEVDRLSGRNIELRRIIKRQKGGAFATPTILQASDAFDVWSFGVVMYEMLCKR
jgi:serine/threonine protein kinase